MMTTLNRFSLLFHGDLQIPISFVQSLASTCTRLYSCFTIAGIELTNTCQSGLYNFPTAC